MRTWRAKNNISLLKHLYERVLWETVAIVSVIYLSHLNDTKHVSTLTVCSTVITVGNVKLSNVIIVKK